MKPFQTLDKAIAATALMAFGCMVLVLLGIDVKHWAAVERDFEAQNKLLHRIIERVYLMEEEVIAITFKAERHLVLIGTTKMPAVFQRRHLEMLSNDHMGHLGASNCAWRESKPGPSAP